MLEHRVPILNNCGMRRNEVEMNLKRVMIAAPKSTGFKKARAAGGFL